MRSSFLRPTGILVGLAVEIVAGCAALDDGARPPSGSTAAANAESSATPAVQGRALVDDIAAGRFDKAVSRFDDRMKRGLPAGVLKQVWGDLQSQAGAFRTVVSTSADAGPPILVYVRCRFEKTDLDAKIALDASGRVAGLFFVPATDQRPWQAPAYVRPGDIHETSLSVGEQPWVLPAVLTTPKSGAPYPAVVLVHGSGPHDMDETVGRIKPFKDLALGLASRGIAVLRYDKRTKVYGKVANEARNTVEDEVITDVVAAVRLIRRRSDIDPRRVYVLGHSLGGHLVPRIVRKIPELAGAIVMAGNTRPLGDIVVDQITYLARLDGAVDANEQKEIAAAEQFRAAYNDPDLPADGSLALFGVPLPNSYWIDLRAYEPQDAAAELAVPLLFLQGERDYQVTMADFEGWKRALRGRQGVTFKAYRDLNHLFIQGSGTPSPAEYDQPGHVAEEVVVDIARFVLGK